MAFLEPSPVETVMRETIIPSATDNLPMKTITLERLFLLSLEKAIFLEKYIGNFNAMNLSLKIKNLLLIKLIIFGIVCLTCSKILAQIKNQQENCYKPAADRPELYLKLLKNKNIAVVANQTSLLADKTHLVDFLVKNNIKIIKKLQGYFL